MQYEVVITKERAEALRRVFGEMAEHNIVLNGYVDGYAGLRMSMRDFAVYVASFGICAIGGYVENDCVALAAETLEIWRANADD